MSDPKNPVPGDKHIDVSDYDLVDITPERVLQLVKVREGVAKAIANLKRLEVEQIERAGISVKQVERAIELSEQHEKLGALIPAAEKLAEMLFETRAMRGHEMATLIGEIAAQARRRGQRDPQGAEILGPLDDLFAYQYGPGQKGAATRAKSKKEGEGSAENAQQGG